MTPEQLYQILRLEYGSVKAAAKEAGVSAETLKKVLSLGFESQFKSQIIAVATKAAEEILEQKMAQCDREINEAKTKKTLYANMLSDVKATATANAA